jgi:hypothetical protein
LLNRDVTGNTTKIANVSFKVRNVTADLNNAVSINALSATTGTFSDLLTANNGLTVNINHGSTNALTVLNNGNVGIGTTNPGAKLDVNGTTYTPQLFINRNVAASRGISWFSPSYSA